MSDILELWPEIVPFREGLLRVSQIHEIRYALYGNPNGVPVFFLHGGPASGCSDDDARWFDPGKYLIVLHDQRGSGKSKPRAEIRDNTPNDLAEDIQKLKTHLNVSQKIILFAGSWGTTLGLLYAEKYPNEVEKMILRGVYLCGYKDQDYMYSEGGGAQYNPKGWEKFIASLPAGQDRIQERLHKLLELPDYEQKRHWCEVQARYEYTFFPSSEDAIEEAVRDFDTMYPEMRINSYYQANRFFLNDNQILKNAESIREIPVTIIHGTRDVICPPMSAWKLHKCLPKSKLLFVPRSDHLSSEPNIREALLREMM